MKQFFKMLIACLTAMFIGGFLFFILLILLSVGLSMTDKPVYVPQANSILHIQLNGNLQDRGNNTSLIRIFAEEPPVIGLNDLLKAINLAKKDPNIAGIYLETDGLSAGYASIEELRDALSRFKTESGKFIVAYANNFTQNQYFLASVAERVILNPLGMIDLRGLTSEHTFIKNTLEKLGIEMQIFKVGQYKSAVEPFIATEMSDANRAQTSIYLSSIWNTICDKIAKDRLSNADSINYIANQMAVLAEGYQYIKWKLVDDLRYRHQVDDLLAQMAKSGDPSSLNLISVPQINSVPPPHSNTSSAIAIVYASGEIDGVSSSYSNSEGINTEKLIKTIYELDKSKQIKGVILRVNSPGGSAFGSEQVWAAIEKLKQNKPVAISMSDYAASGGYYISCNANRIFAQRTTITGSIGIFGMVPNASNLLTQKLGLSFDEVRTNKYGNFPSIHRSMTADEKALMQGYVERGYNLFVSRCAIGRKMSTDSLNNIAQGRVWSGDNALHIGLIDEIGGVQDAIDWVAQSANIDSYKISEYPHQKTLYEELIEQVGSTMKVKLLDNFLHPKKEYDRISNFIRNFDPLQARMGIINVE